MQNAQPFAGLGVRLTAPVSGAVLCKISRLVNAEIVKTN